MEWLIERRNSRSECLNSGGTEGPKVWGGLSGRKVRVKDFKKRGGGSNIQIGKGRNYKENQKLPGEKEVVQMYAQGKERSGVGRWDKGHLCLIQAGRNVIHKREIGMGVRNRSQKGMIKNGGMKWTGYRAKFRVALGNEPWGVGQINRGVGNGLT